MDRASAVRYERNKVLGWVAAVDFRRGGNGCADQPCRNFGKLEKLHNGVVLGAVADGMNSAAHGYLGAKVSVRSGLGAVRADAEVLSVALASGSREARDAVFAKVMETCVITHNSCLAL